MSSSQFDRDAELLLRFVDAVVNSDDHLPVVNKRIQENVSKPVHHPAANIMAGQHFFPTGLIILSIPITGYIEQGAELLPEPMFQRSNRQIILVNFTIDIYTRHNAGREKRPPGAAQIRFFCSTLTAGPAGRAARRSSKYRYTDRCRSLLWPSTPVEFRSPPVGNRWRYQQFVPMFWSTDRTLDRSGRGYRQRRNLHRDRRGGNTDRSVRSRRWSSR
jgi:hypothetical protein